MAEVTNYLTAEFPGKAFKNADGGITVEQMLNEPRRIDRYVAAKIDEDLLSTRIYNTTTTSGGAMIYNQLLGTSEQIAGQRTGIVAPGGEFPTFDNERTEEDVVRVQKIGGKVAITDEAVKRNDSAELNRHLLRMANRMKLDLDADAVAAFRAAMDKLDPTLKEAHTVTSTGWGTVNKTKAADKVPATSIEADLLKALQAAEDNELGYNYSTLLINPKDMFNLRLAVGVGATAEFLGQFGLTADVTSTVEPGEAYLIAPRQVGTIGVESPISTETWREAKFQTSYIQTWATMAHAVTDPLAIITLKGLSA